MIAIACTALLTYQQGDETYLHPYRQDFVLVGTISHGLQCADIVIADRAQLWDGALGNGFAIAQSLALFSRFKKSAIAQSDTFSLTLISKLSRKAQIDIAM